MITLVADTLNGIAVADLEQLSDLVLPKEVLDPDDFITALDQVQDGEAIAATFDEADERLPWLDEEYGIHGWIAFKDT